ncbi:MAG: cytochrome c biogenesis protein ResB [Geothermobacteraceae bacterium]
MTTRDKSFFEHIWDFFCSLKLAIATLILLAITSIIGTVIQQNANPQDYIREYGPTAYKIFVALDFLDMYHSWWFITLLIVFAVNLTCCSIKRLPRIVRIVAHPEKTPDEKFFRTLGRKGEVETSLSAEEAAGRAAEAVGRLFGRTERTDVDGRICLFTQKMAWSRFGVYVVHASILVIFAGALMGAFWGYKAFVNIPEGSSSDKVWPRNSNQPIELGFTVRCDRFDVEFYPNSRRPREFVSDLVVLEDGKEVLKKTIEVNDPLTYKGITFYQSSYGPMGNPLFHFKVRERATGETVEVKVRQGEPAALPGGAAFRVADFTEQFQNFGAAARIELLPGMTHDHKPGERHPSFVVLKNFPDFDAQRGGKYIFSLLDFKQRYYTGLQVAKDPGVWVVWLGCFMMVVGCFAAFFLSHRRIWVVVQATDKGSRVLYGGNAHRNQPAFEIWFENFSAQLEDAVKNG